MVPGPRDSTASLRKEGASGHVLSYDQQQHSLVIRLTLEICLLWGSKESTQPH